MTAPVLDAAGVRLFHGDCIEVMRQLPDSSVHAVVTDPPYGIAFMGKAWDQPGEFGSARRGRTRSVPMNSGGIGDHKQTTDRSGAMIAGDYDLSPSAMRNFQRWCEAWAVECLRVLKPGGWLLSFGGSRTWHRLAAGVEDAGFEMRDSIAWLYGSGFPKSLDVSKALDAAAGAQRTVISEGKPVKRMIPGADQNATGSCVKDNGREYVPQVSEPTSDAAKQWAGLGTALKPAFEPVVVARKPLVGTVAANVLAHGTGALNIDANRIEFVSEADRQESVAKNQHAAFGTEAGGNNVYGDYSGTEVKNYDGSKGRWPTNVLLDESQAAELDAQTGVTVSRVGKPRGAASGDGWGMTATGAEYADAGGASRFFPTFRYEAKAGTFERPVTGGVQHPTVKPLALMRWLVRLVTPPGGVVLEPFAGSGTTLEACIREGFECIGIEREADYLPLIEARLSKPQQQSLFGDWAEGDIA